MEKWKKYRIDSGEAVNSDSWVMRNIWNTKKGYTRGLVSVPVRLQSLYGKGLQVTQSVIDIAKELRRDKRFECA